MAKSIRLLIVDDEAAVRKILRVGIEPKGYLIEEAATGHEGLEKVVQFQPEIILLDLGLPDIDGLSFLKSLREWSKLPVVVLTVRDSESDKVALLEAGADDYLTKPFGLPELMARLKVAMRHYNSTQESKPFFKAGRLEISYTDHLVIFDGQPVKLTTTEYKLLRLLAQGQGKVVTQQQLVDEIWGLTSGGTAHYLRVYIGHLRKKLEFDSQQDASSSLITTEPGVGYRLNIDAL
jgi:two-component system KDP operon response regulator KdpE